MGILVTGASGQLGGRIAQCLLDAGLGGDVRPAGRSMTALVNLTDQGAQPVPFDYDEPDSMVTAFEGIDTVILIPTFAQNPLRVIQTQQAINAATVAGVRRLVWCGFQASHRDSRFHAAPCMAYGEAAVRTSGLGWTVLRNGMYMEPFLQWVPDLVQEGRIPYPAGHGRVAYVLRDDLARATAAVAMDDSHIGAAWDLTGPEALGYGEIAEIVSDVTGQTVSYEPATGEAFVDMCRDPDLPEQMLLTLLSMYQAVAAREFEPATDAIERITGTAPTGFRTALTRLWGAL